MPAPDAARLPRIEAYYPPIDYRDAADVFRPYDDRFPHVAALVGQVIAESDATLVVEHVGSTAIPNCAGKGVIDLMIPYRDGQFEETLAVVQDLGFQIWRSRDPFPETRPVLIGSIQHDGTRFRLHLHLIPEADPEVINQRHFRETLRDNPALIEEYQASKLASLQANPADGTDYNLGKDVFIKRVMANAQAE